MSSLLPFLQDLLPMIMPAPVAVVRARELEARQPAAELAVTQRDAILDHCDKMCASGKSASLLPGCPKRTACTRLHPFVRP